MRWPSFRTLTADVPGELLAAQVATTNRAAEAAHTETAAVEAWIPAPEYPQIWAALANRDSDHATAAPFVPAPTAPNQ
jgi:hypothetical protein